MSVPSVFGLPHLSEDAVAAFADGVLSAAATARARRHCEECAECAAAVRGQREAAMMLRAATAPSLPSGLLARLAGLPMSATLPPTSGGLPTALDPNGVPVFVAHARESKADHKRAEASRQKHAHPKATEDSDGSSDAEPHHKPQPNGADFRAARSSGALGLRRGVLPVGLIASAAAVVAAGTMGAPVSSLAGFEQPSGDAAVAPALVSQPLAGTAQTGGRPAMRLSSPLADPAAVPASNELAVVLDEVGAPSP
jgi:hypothetical protein